MTTPQVGNITRHRSRVALIGLGAALITALVAAGSGFGYRWGWWDFSDGFVYLKWAFYGSFGALAISLLGCLLARPGGRHRGFPLALIGVFLSSIVAWIPWSALQNIRTLPPIHDITTDVDNPPGFVTVLPLRDSDSNSTDYAGATIAALQRQGYPDIKPLVIRGPLKEVFELSLMAAQNNGWDIVAADPNAGRIEATVTTFWYGFKDDVVIRISPQSDDVRIDVRSVSRVGGSDAGANAAHIRAFFDTFERVSR